jgi:hypothetical protein
MLSNQGAKQKHAGNASSHAFMICPIDEYRFMDVGMLASLNQSLHQGHVL